MAKVTLSIRIEDELKAKVMAQAKDEYRSATDLTVQALREYLQRQEGKQ